MNPPLDEAARRTLTVVCDTFMPRLTPGTGDDTRLFSIGAADVGLAQAVEHALEALSLRQCRELALFLRLLESRVFMLAVTGRARGLGVMEASEREAALRSLAGSRIPQLRAGFQAVKRLSTFLFYSVLDAHGSNPTWASLGYAVPAPRPAREGLAVITPATSMVLDADACVVGSGAGGGVVAARLAAAGMRVVVLEAGPADQARDFDQREVMGMQRLYLDRGTTATRDLGVALLAGSCVGGGTTVNWQTSLRLPDYIRAEWAERSGIPAFSDGRFESATDRVCDRLGVGTSESRRNGNNAALERGCVALGFRWREIPRNARGCDFGECGFCVFGCRAGAKQSTANTYLHDAQHAGDVRIIAGCKALRVRIDAGRATGVDAQAHAAGGVPVAVQVRARVVVAACGAIETPALLLRSQLRHPAIGRNLFLHPTSGVAGRYEDRIEGWIGAPQTVLCDEFDRLRGNYGVRIETAPVHPGLLALAQPWYGARQHREHMQHVAHASAFVVLARDARAGYVTIDGEGRAVVHYTPGVRERALLHRGIVEAARVHWAAGATEIHTLHATDHTFRRAATNGGFSFERYLRQIAAAPVHGNRSTLFSAHQMGTCRMGTDARDSVCDERGGVRGVAGLYVADASLFPASSGVNPMITVMAMAQLVADAIAERGG